MPSLWDKLRGSRKKVKIRSKSVNDSADEDEFLASIKKRESFIEGSKTDDWIEVTHPKSQSLGRGMKLESEKKAKSATLDGSMIGFSFKKKSEWKPKVKDVEEVKLKVKTKGRTKGDKVEGDVKAKDKKDKRKSRELDYENAQLERGESTVVGRKMVLFRSDRKRLSKSDMEPVSTVDMWAASRNIRTSPTSRSPGSPGSVSVQTPGSVQASISSGTTPLTPHSDLETLVEVVNENDAALPTAIPSTSAGFQPYGTNENQGPMNIYRKRKSTPERPMSFHERGSGTAPVPPMGVKVKIQRHKSVPCMKQHLPDPAIDAIDAGAQCEVGPVLHSPKKVSLEVVLDSTVSPTRHPPPLKIKPKSRSRDSLQSPTYESRLALRTSSSPSSPRSPSTPTSPKTEVGPILKPPSKIPKVKKSRSQLSNNSQMTTVGASMCESGPVLTPPKSMAQKKIKSQGTSKPPMRDSHDNKLVSYCKTVEPLSSAGIGVQETNVSAGLALQESDKKPTADPDLTENNKVNLHSSLLNHDGDRRTIDSALPPDSVSPTSVSLQLNGARSQNGVDSIRPELNAQIEIVTGDAQSARRPTAANGDVDLSSDTSGNATVITENVIDDDLVESTHRSGIVSSDSMVLVNNEDAPKINNGDVVVVRESHDDGLHTTVIDNESKPEMNPELPVSVKQKHAAQVKGVSSFEGGGGAIFDQLHVDASLNGNCAISPNGAGDTLANTTADEFYIMSTKYYEGGTGGEDENEMFKMEFETLEDSKDEMEILQKEKIEKEIEIYKRQVPEMEIQIQIPEKIPPTEKQRLQSSIRNFEPLNPISTSAQSSPCRGTKPICLVAYPRRLVNLSPCERCSRSIDSVLSGEYSELESPILEQDVHDWVLVDKDFESPKISKRKLDKSVQTDLITLPIDILKKQPRVVSSSSSSLAEMRAPSIERNSYLEDLDSMEDYSIPIQLLRPSDAHYRISGQCSDEFDLFGQVSPLGQSCNSPLEEEPKKSTTAKAAVSQIKGHQPDLVSNSIGSRAHAAQEISRLEALCESRTKELTFAKMQIKSASQGFDAMSVIVQYLSHELDAFSSPELNSRLKTAEKKISGLLTDLGDLKSEKSRIESTMHDLIQSHKEGTEAMKADHRTQLAAAEERVYKRHQDDIQKVVDQHSEEVKTLKSYHDKRYHELEENTERQAEEMRKKHSRQLKDLAESDERHLSELQKQHEIKLEEITKRFEEIKHTLHDKVYSLKAECDELRSRSMMYEEALQRDTDFQVQKKPDDKSQLALAPYRDLPQEIDSLRAVLEMRNAEIHELRTAKVELERQLEQLPCAREKIISLEQKIENLEAIVAMKADYERQLVEKHQLLLRRFDKESKANKRLSMDNEELMYRLNETEDMLLSPSPDRTGASPIGAPDIMARRAFCRSPHESPQQSSPHMVTRRQRTSSTSSSDDKRSSTVSMRSEDEKGT